MYRITEKKYQNLIKELDKYEINPYDENNNIPNKRDLAHFFNCDVTKVSKLVRDLVQELIHTSTLKPFEVKDYIHVIHIGFHDERLRWGRKKDKNPIFDEFTWIELKLPYTPRIGEEISFDFLEGWYFDHGYIHNINHRIDGAIRRIHIDVHPLDNYYSKWQKMKEEYEDRERWRRMNS